MYENPILVVEDEPDGQELVSRMLKVINVDIEVAGDGETGWDMLHEKNYTMAIIDLALPGMGGIELLNLIRDSDALQNLPCVAITAYHTPELKQQALAAGFDSYFAKPLDRTLFLEALDGLLES
ncbi:MAG: response regulator [Anaerolineae bacterium]|nr:response regulator [Anaerolineae bacterium]